LALALAATLLAAAAGQTQDQAVRLSIVADKSCLIQPESDPSVLGDQNDVFHADAICHLESMLSSHHIEEKITDGLARGVMRVRDISQISYLPRIAWQVFPWPRSDRNTPPQTARIIQAT
jgi:hypothetical protein